MNLRKQIEHFVLKVLAVPKSPRVIEGKKHIACIGDSITFGAGVKGLKKETWEYLLNEKFGDDYQVINYGISGRTLQDEGDYPYKNDKFYKESKDSLADIYLIMLGTNDAKPYNWNEDRYKIELDKFVKEYIELGNHPRVILMTPPSCFKDKKTGVVAFDIDENNIDNYIVDTVKEIGNKYSIQVIDLHDYTKNHEDWFADGVHPNYLGNQKIAEYIYTQL